LDGAAGVKVLEEMSRVTVSEEGGALIDRARDNVIGRFSGRSIVHSVERAGIFENVEMT
jgi:hypothetical protein